METWNRRIEATKETEMQEESAAGKLPLSNSNVCLAVAPSVEVIILEQLRTMTGVELGSGGWTEGSRVGYRDCFANGICVVEVEGIDRKDKVLE
jgi:hypothetical protein